MIVQCPSCASRYRVNDANVPASGGKITCPSCQHKFIVYPEEQNPTPGASTSDDLEDKTSVAFRPDINKLVNQMQQTGGAQQSGEDGVAATEVMSGDSIPDFLNNADIPEDGTIEMKNPFEGGQLPGFDRPRPGMDEEDVAPTEVVSGDMLDNLGFDEPHHGGAQSSQAPPQSPQQRPNRGQNQQFGSAPPKQPSGPTGNGPSFEETDGPSGPNGSHDGPWKLKTNFGLTYEFPDTKSLRNWLSNREDLDGYTLSGDGDNFHGLDAWPQIAGGPAQSGPQQPPSFPQNSGSSPHSPGGPGAGAAGMPGNSLATRDPAPSAPVPSPSADPPGKKIKPKEYRPPSRDGKWNGLLWGVVLILLVVAGGLSVQMFGIYDIKGELLGMKSAEQPDKVETPPVEEEEAAAAKQDQDPAEGESGPNPKLVKEVNRLIDDAERAVENNRLQTAAEKLQNAKLLAPERVEVYEMLAEVYAEMGQDKEAEAAKKKVAELNASNDPGDEAGEEASNK